MTMHEEGIRGQVAARVDGGDYMTTFFLHNFSTWYWDGSNDWLLYNLESGYNHLAFSRMWQGLLRIIGLKKFFSKRPETDEIY
ncbi:hypothetical protein Dimus_018545 [Dionaea muscipula]